MLSAGLAVLIVAVAVLRAVRRARQRAAAAARLQRLQDGVALLAVELEAGQRANDALAGVGMVDPELAVALRVRRRGERAPPELCTVRSAWQVATISGLPLADVLNRVANDLDERMRQHAAVRVALAGARASAVMLTALPLLGLLLGGSIGAHPVALLLGSSPGHALLLGGICLDVAGASWTGWLLRRAEQRR